MTVYAYLIALNGPRAGYRYRLETERPTQIGRGLECDIVLTDPLSSREHAIVEQEGHQWWLRDQSSSNGTFVHNQKVDEAQLAPNSEFRIGSTEFRFQISERPPIAGQEDTEDDLSITATLCIDRAQVLEEANAAVSPDQLGVAALQDPSRGQDFLVLYQLSLRLLGSDDPDEVVRTTLDLLKERTRASHVGFLWIDDEGELKPKAFLNSEQLNEQDKAFKLSRSLTQSVCEQKRAIHFSNQANFDISESMSDFADAICAPLVHQGKTVGAIHLYSGTSPFRPSDFEMAISIANILAVALNRANQHRKLQADHTRLVAKSGSFDELIGDSQPMRELKSKISRVARATGCVLIRGESGAGKELVARAIHRSSAREDRPMLSVNCAAIPRELMESQLFGHKKGAFTSAEADHTGWFQQADTGTLFLDEVGELTLEGQAKLLRILEGHPFLPVGATKEINVDVRVIAATNRDLREFVREKNFREDLYYRLSVFELYVPPLRERGEDIETLANFFLDRFRVQHGRPQLALSAEARQKLLSYGWPGNVRQLRNVLDSAIVMAEGDAILPEDLGLRDVGREEDAFESLKIDYWERHLIKQALKRTSNNVPEAAKLLGIGRATLYRKIDDYGIDRSS